MDHEYLFIVETKTKSLKGSEPEVSRKSHGQGYRNFISIYRFNLSTIIKISDEHVSLSINSLNANIGVPH